MFSNIAAGFVRWGTAALIAGLCAFLGFSPPEWIAAVIASPPPWLIHPYARLGIVLIGVLMVTAILTYQRRTANIRIEYPNQANLPHLQSIFRRSSSLLASGVPRAERITEHEFLVGLINPTTKATARNARLTAISLSKPIHAINLVFKPVHSNSDRVDVQPGGTELFLVVHGYDQSDVGMFSPRVLPPEQFDQISKERQERAYIGAHLISWQGNRTPLLKNDGYIVELRAYADDVRPRSALMVVNAKSQLSVYVYHSRLHMRLAYASAAVAARLRTACAKLRFGRAATEPKPLLEAKQVIGERPTIEPAAAATQRPTEERKTRAGQKFVSLSLSELMQRVYEGRTALQASGDIAQYIGGRMVVEGQVALIQPQMGDGPIIALLRHGAYAAECRFDPGKWAHALEQVPLGANLKIEGTVGPLVNAQLLALVECDVVSR